MRILLQLVLRVAALPAVGHAALVIALYSTEGLLAQALALVFVLASSVGVLFWVGRTITSHVGKYHQGHAGLPPGLNSLLPKEFAEQSAVDQLAVVTRSMVFYTLLSGYVVLAMVFGLTYDALEVTTADTLANNIYFSLTTLTTVGYGDIQPVGFGRLLASVEMIVGLTYQVLAIGGGMAYVSGLGKAKSSD
jgi:hypothetical protein